MKRGNNSDFFFQLLLFLTHNHQEREGGELRGKKEKEKEETVAFQKMAHEREEEGRGGQGTGKKEKEGTVAKMAGIMDERRTTTPEIEAPFERSQEKIRGWRRKRDLLQEGG